MCPCRSCKMSEACKRHDCICMLCIFQLQTCSCLFYKQKALLVRLRVQLQSKNFQSVGPNVVFDFQCMDKTIETFKICVPQKKETYRFGTTQGLVNDGRFFIFVWTTTWKEIRPKKAKETKRPSIFNPHHTDIVKPTAKSSIFICHSASLWYGNDRPGLEYCIQSLICVTAFICVVNS